MKRILFLLGLFLLCGCSTPQSKQPYPDVKVSRLLRVIDGDTFRCDINEHSAIAGKKIFPSASGASILLNCEARTRRSANPLTSKNNVFPTY